MDLSRALQVAVGAALAADAATTALVPATNIFDRSLRPEVFPCIVLGEGQTVDPGLSLDRSLMHVFLDLHIWTESESVASVKTIAGAVTDVLRRSRLALTGAKLIDQRVQAVRYMRDPSGKHAHAVVTLETLASYQ